MVVRGFSKYTRMTIHRRSASSSRSPASRVAYSRAPFSSWIEHGPMTTSSRGSVPSRIRSTAARPSTTVRLATVVIGRRVLS
jgi:hypothetical protein